MGARFINDEEVASSDACMKLCCSTNDCDVFVFEEKVSKYLTGHCYDQTEEEKGMSQYASTKQSLSLKACY